MGMCPSTLSSVCFDAGADQAPEALAKINDSPGTRSVLVDLLMHGFIASELSILETGHRVFPVCSSRWPSNSVYPWVG